MTSYLGYHLLDRFWMTEANLQTKPLAKNSENIMFSVGRVKDFACAELLLCHGHYFGGGVM